MSRSIETPPEPEADPEMQVSATGRTVLRPTGRPFDAAAAVRAERDAVAAIQPKTQVE